MGTRNLTIAVLDKKYRIAQYGQWDGYPEGQGKTVLEFLSGWDRKKFEAGLRCCSFYTQAELNKLQKQIEAGGIKDSWQSKYPHMSRDMGAGILKHVQDSGGLKLRDQLPFAGDSLFCEFAYLLDLDNDVLEVYRGFNKEKLTPKDRFFDVKGLEKSEGYEPIKLVMTYSLKQLPSVAQMSEDVEREEAEDK